MNNLNSDWNQSHRTIKLISVLLLSFAMVAAMIPMPTHAITSISEDPPTVINFDDLTNSGTMPSGYAGLEWSGWTYYNNVQPEVPTYYYPNSGTCRLYSTTENAFFVFPQPVNFIGAYLNGMSIPITYKGYLNGVQIATSSAFWLSDTPTLQQANFGVLVDKVVVDAGVGSYGNYVMDDVTYSLSLDSTAPLASVVSATLTVGDNVTTAQSNELGFVYLVDSTADITDKASLDLLVSWGAARMSTVTMVNSDMIIDTSWLDPGTYVVYAVDQSSNVSEASTGTITLIGPPDTTAPYAGVTSAALTVGDNVTTAQSNELGFVYLVASGAAITDKASLDALVSSGSANMSTVSAVNTDTIIPTTGLAPGNYHVYAVDEASNVSEASMGVIVLSLTPDTTSPIASVTSATLTVGDFVTTAQSNELGNLYLVNSSASITDKESLDALVYGEIARVTDVYNINTDTFFYTWGLPTGTYKVYAVDLASNVSAASTGTITLIGPPDITKPYASVTTAALTVGDNVTTAQSNELGFVYLVATGAAITDKASLDALVSAETASVSPVSEMNTDTIIPTTSLAPGAYHVYAVDLASNVSAPSNGIITLSAPTDTTPPIASVNTDELTVGDDVPTAQSNELGFIYLVDSSATITNKASLDMLVAGGTAKMASILSVNTNTIISTTGLAPGIYHVYAVDLASNVSEPSTGFITLSLSQEPVEKIVTSIEISGPEFINIPFGKKITVKVAYKVKVFDQFGKAMKGIPVEWSILGDNPAGVSINSDSGLITVKAVANPGQFGIQALHVATGVFDQHSVTLLGK